MKKGILTVLTAVFASLAAVADEGMWLPSLIGERIKDMRSKGFRLTAEDIYSVNKASMKDAVVLFGRGCTGEIVSAEGLLLTNHHCGYGAIQSHSTLDHDYLTYGFWARSRDEELPNERLTVRILVRMEDVTDRIAAGADKLKLIQAARAEGPGYDASVEEMYYGNQSFLFVYQEFSDVRLVGAPPSSLGKFGGATGNFNAHRVAYPDIDWREFAAKFLSERLGIKREALTTQISNYDNLAALFDALRRINTIVLDLDRDMWMYISMEYFKQKIKAGEVGSSAMPHKVNPIDFENSEGNLGIANAILGHLATKLPVSRLQRDLTDSTVLRNVGVPLAHGLIAIGSTLKGLNKLLLNRDAIDNDLNAMWSVVAEGIQTILRREGYPHPYETLKQLTRTNSTVTAESISEFIDTLDVTDSVREELHRLSPHTYTGY